MKARVVQVSGEVNPGKLAELDRLHAAYRTYVQGGVELMVRDRRPQVFLSEMRSYFPPSEILSSQILKCAQVHAASTVYTWVKTRYAQRLRSRINQQDLTDQQRLELRCIGKYFLRTAGKFGKGTISQEMLDLYWSWIWDPTITGNTPVVSEHFPIWMTEMTCSFGTAKNAGHFGWWIKVSALDNGHRIQIPLAPSPYLKEGLAKTVMAQKRQDRWVFQFCDKTPAEKFDGSAGKVGVDVGLNVLAATSDGRLYGADLKPKFDRLYRKVRDIRANRQRQQLKRDSKRLHRLEKRLSGLVKTATGTVANKLVRDYPGHTFVVEDLDLRGCRGQKRFAYRALHHSLGCKAATEAVNPAYTSQMCPSCGYISRENRRGIKFECRGCGRKCHADVAGGMNLLGRSGDKQVRLDDNPIRVLRVLRERYRHRRSGSAGSGNNEPAPPGQRLTVRRKPGTASNQVAEASRMRLGECSGISPVSRMRL